MAQLPTAAQVQARLRDSFALDEQWGLTMGLPDGGTKEEHPDLEPELPGVRERLAHVDDMIRGK